MYRNQTFLMKKNSLLSVAFLAVLAANASAAFSQNQSEPLKLPTYVVESERFAPAEQYINASLNALRRQAGTPVAISLELPALKVQVAHIAKELSVTRLAKF